MRKSKRVFVMVLAVAMVFCMMAIPASAAKDFVDSVSDSGELTGADWYTYLEVNGKTAIARLNVIKKKSGLIPQVIVGSLAGEILKGSTIAPLYDFVETTDESLIAYDSYTLGEDISYAYCDYWADGIHLGTFELPK